MGREVILRGGAVKQVVGRAVGVEGWGGVGWGEVGWGGVEGYLLGCPRQAPDIIAGSRGTPNICILF